MIEQSGSRSHIVAVIHGLPFGGAEKVLISLANRINRGKFRLTIICLSTNNPLISEIRSEQSKPFIFNKQWRYDLSPARKIRDFINANHVDAIVCFGLYEYFFVYKAMKSAKCSPRVLISIHNLRPSNWGDSFKHWSYSKVLKGSERFISVCNTQAEYWSRAYKIPRSHFTTIYNGVDVNHFTLPDFNTKLQTRQRLGIPSEMFVLVKVANFSNLKNHEGALKALHIVQNTHSGVSVGLVLVGSGTNDREAQLRYLSKQLGILDQVFFFGTQKDVRPFYHAADVFTLTSRLETFSVAAIEAMATGLPCVLTKVGGAEEMIAEEINGYLIRRGNPKEIARVWLRSMKEYNSFNRAEIRAGAVRQFNIETTIEKYEAILS